jgi:hypothetical protein
MDFNHPQYFGSYDPLYLSTNKRFEQRQHLLVGSELRPATPERASQRSRQQ